MLVLTADLQHLIRSMKTRNPLAMITNHRDQTLLACEAFFRRIILNGQQVLVGEKERPVQMNNSGFARAQHHRDGLMRVEGPIDAPAVDIPWN
jgi:hypothetical protein